MPQQCIYIDIQYVCYLYIHIGRADPQVPTSQLSQQVTASRSCAPRSSGARSGALLMHSVHSQFIQTYRGQRIEAHSLALLLQHLFAAAIAKSKWRSICLSSSRGLFRCQNAIGSQMLVDVQMQTWLLLVVTIKQARAKYMPTSWRTGSRDVRMMGGARVRAFWDFGRPRTPKASQELNNKHISIL